MGKLPEHLHVIQTKLARRALQTEVWLTQGFDQQQLWFTRNGEDTFDNNKWR